MWGGRIGEEELSDYGANLTVSASPMGNSRTKMLIRVPCSMEMAKLLYHSSSCSVFGQRPKNVSELGFLHLGSQFLPDGEPLKQHISLLAKDFVYLI